MKCAECGKPYEHDQYISWCNPCGEKIEKKMIEQLPGESQAYGNDCRGGQCE